MLRKLVCVIYVVASYNKEKRMEIREGLTFDDVLLVPNYSEIESRASVDLSVELPKGIKLKNPIIPANMKTVTGRAMAQAMHDLGGMAILHRFMTLPLQIEAFKNIHNYSGEYLVEDHVGFSIGVKHSDEHAVRCWAEAGAKIACVDVAHGDSKLTLDMCEWIAKTYPEMLLIAGNVATGSGARRLWNAGVDVVKVGVGPGSLCTTRIETGNGVPQLTALMDVAEERDKLKTNVQQKTLPIIADGGIKNAGDCVKALCFADLVMAGNIFAGAIETPGNTVTMNGLLYKEYVGSSTHKTNHVEGVSAMVPQKGHVRDIMTKLLEGVRSGCSYQGSRNLLELKDNPQFVKITNAGLKESHPHDVILK